MPRLVILGAVLMIALAYLYDWLKRNQASFPKSQPPSHLFKRSRSKADPQELWAQVFETSEREEAERLKARLEEEDIKVIMIEQAKRDLHGNTPPGIGIAVPRSALITAQSLICRYLENH